MSGNVPAPAEKDPARIVRAIRELFEGRSNAVGTFTLTANATTTVVAAPNCAVGSTVLLSPRTAHAANDMATTSVVAAKGSFTVTHANNGRNDRTFGYVCLG